MQDNQEENFDEDDLELVTNLLPRNRRQPPREVQKPKS